MLSHPFHARQRHSNNVPEDDPRTYYRRCIWAPLVDQPLVELEARFSHHHRVALLGLCLVPSALVTLPNPDVRSHLAKLVDIYEEYLASPESVFHQMVSWKIKWQKQMAQHGKTCLPASPSQGLPHTTRSVLRHTGIVVGALHIAGYKLFE